MPELHIRAYAPGDEAAIWQLFEASFGHRIQEEEWRWRYTENPSGDVQILLAWDGDTLAGHYAVCPQPLEWEGSLIKAALSMTTMTHPAYRGQGLFPRLAEGLYAAMKADGYQVVYGFPNRNSHYAFRKKLGWQDVCIVPNLQCRLPLAKASSFQAEELRKPPAAACTWRAAFQEVQGLGLATNATWFNWRYTQHPTQPYRYLSSDPSHNVAVVKLYQPEEGSGNQLDILELLAETAAAWKALLEALFGFAHPEDSISALNTWCPVHHPYFQLLEKRGFEPRGHQTYMGYRTLTPACDAILAQNRSWATTMAFSDIY